MKNLLFVLIFLFLFHLPVYAGGLDAPQNISLRTAKCDVNDKEHYAQFTWDLVDNATTYEVYGKPVGENIDFTYYGYTTTQIGVFVKKNVEYVFYVVAKGDGATSPKSKEYILNKPTLELMCKIAREQRPWYEMKITSINNNNFKLGDWMFANFNLSYNQPGKEYYEKDFSYKAFLYKDKNPNIRYIETTFNGNEGKKIEYRLSDIPTGYYTLRIMLNQVMTDGNGSEGYPSADSENTIYIYGQSNTPSPTIIPNITPVPCTDSDFGYDYYKKGITVGYAANGEVTKREDSCREKNFYNDGYEYVIEWFCSPIKDGKQYVTNTNEKCLYGCSNGACLKEPSVSIQPKDIQELRSEISNLKTQLKQTNDQQKTIMTEITLLKAKLQSFIGQFLSQLFRVNPSTK